VEAGKTGKVLQILASRGRAVVEGLRIVKKHARKTQDNPKGGVVQKEASMDLSNLMLYCPHCKKGVRVARVTDGEKKVRKCRRCGHPFEG
jgi:large subunit ribosomal protein L24